jgi:hypothetical protein
LLRFTQRFTKSVPKSTRDPRYTRSISVATTEEARFNLTASGNLLKGPPKKVSFSEKLKKLQEANKLEENVDSSDTEISSRLPTVQGNKLRLREQSQITVRLTIS